MKLPKEITLNHITAVITIVGFLFGATSGILYMKFTGEQNAEKIEDTNESVEDLKNTFNERIKVNDAKSDKQKEEIGDISKDVAVVKSQVSDIKDGQTVMIGQMQQFQTTLSTLTAAIVRKDMAERDSLTPRPATYEASR